MGSDMEGVTMETLCPQCGALMALRTRRSDGEQFWGCTRYPNCKGVRRCVEARLETKKFVPSKYQVAIYDWLVYGTGNAVVSATAGSGKSSTIVAALEYVPYAVANARGLIPAVPVTEVLPLLTPDRIAELMVGTKVAFLAFNKHIAKELSRRAPEYVYVSTLHSLGYSNIRASFGNVKVDDKKSRNLLSELLQKMVNKPQYRAFYETVTGNMPTIYRLVSLCKATLRPPTKATFNYLVDRYGIALDENEHYIYMASRLLFYASVKQQHIIDYDDMIYFPAVGIVPCEKFNFLFVDETQDLCPSQIELVLKSIVGNDIGRAICVGDHKQSLHGFRAADVDAIPNIIKALNATVLPLSITYRCPRSHVALAQRIVPEIQAAPNAKEGYIHYIGKGEFYRLVQPGDMVLCRTNAPLVEPAFALIRNGVKAMICGRDIGTGLTELITRLQKRYRIGMLDELVGELRRYQSTEVTKLLKAEKNSRAQLVEDQVETIMALADGCDSIAELVSRIESVFSDDVSGVVFSSVHRAKGLEAERVFILYPSLMPHKMATQDWELVQEDNVIYVSRTRAKDALYFVE